MVRFQLSLESLETRETPSATISLAQGQAPADSFSGTGIYTSADSGRTSSAAGDWGGIVYRGDSDYNFEYR